jgi:hypothetical protein
MLQGINFHLGKLDNFVSLGEKITIGFIELNNLKEIINKNNSIITGLKFFYDRYELRD